MQFIKWVIILLLIGINSKSINATEIQKDAGRTIDNCSYASNNHTVCEVSIYSLVINPEEYYKQEFFVIGYLAIDYGVLKLWTDNVSFEHDIDANSIILDIAYKDAVTLAKKHNRSYCALIGILGKAKDKHYGMHSTESIIHNVSNLHPVGDRVHSKLDWMILHRIETDDGSDNRSHNEEK